METWIVYRMNPYGSPKIEAREVQATDAASAMSASGFSYNEVICVKLKMVTETVVGL